MRQLNERQGRWVHSRLLAMLVGALLLFATGEAAWFWHPALRWDLRRYPWWVSTLLHFNEAGALVLCVQWVVTGITSRSFAAPVQGGRFSRGQILWYVAFFGAWLVNCVTLYWTLDAQDAAFQRSRPVAGMAVRGAGEQHWSATGYRYLYCTYPDQNGRRREARLHLGQTAGLPVVGSPTPNSFPFPIPLRYDPEWPDRSWPVGYNPDDQNEWLWTSIIPLILTLIVMIVLVPRPLPHDLNRVVPLVVQVVFWLCWAQLFPEMRAN